MKQVVLCHGLVWFLALLSSSALTQTLVINEMMINPDTVTDSLGEWIEIYNPTASDIDLNAWQLRQAALDTHIIDNGAPLLVPAGGYLVLGKSSNISENGNVAVAYAFGESLALPNDSGKVSLHNPGGVEIDRVEYDDGLTFPSLTGASIELVHYALPNRIGANWVAASSAWDFGDLGTPGGANTGFDANAAAAPGDIVVSEIMKNPDASFDAEGEWFEVYNLSGKDIDMNGWTIYDNGTNLIEVEGSFIVPAGDFSLFVRKDDPLINGGVNHERMYDWGIGVNFNFDNSDDEVIIRMENTLMDSVAFTDQTFPDPIGASMVLTNVMLDNNDGKYWVEATLREPAFDGSEGDFGSPGRKGFDQTTVDTFPPVPVLINVISDIRVDVTFDEPVESGTATNTLNYSINEAIGNPLTATIDPEDHRIVNLTTNQLGDEVTYTLTVSNVEDLFGNAIASADIDFALGLPVPGSIIITEVLVDPGFVSDANGEYIEIYNTTQDTIDIQGWSFFDNAIDSFTVNGSFIVPPQAFSLVLRNDDPLINGNLDHQRMYDWGAGVDMALQTDDQIIMRFRGITVDSIDYNISEGWPITEGAAMVLSDFTMDRNDPLSWSSAALRELAFIGLTGDLGSPGRLGVDQTAAGIPDIRIPIDTLSFFLSPDGVADVDDFEIRNVGDGPLDWEIIEDGGIDCPWLAVVPSSGSIEPLTGVATINITADPAGFAAGVYYCTLTVQSDDPDTPNWDLVMEMNVLAKYLTVAFNGIIAPVPASGDTFAYPIAFGNLTGVTHVPDMWVTMKLPTGLVQTVLDKHPPLQAFQSFNKSPVLRIPANRPAGEYQLIIHLGTNPGDTVCADTATFEKLAPSAGLNADLELIPDEMALYENYPNPFNPTTRIRYGLSEDTNVKITIYNILGQEIIQLVNERQKAGYRTAYWDSKNSFGQSVASGIYIYRMEVDGFSGTHKMLLTK